MDNEQIMDNEQLLQQKQQSINIQEQENLQQQENLQESLNNLQDQVHVQEQRVAQPQEQQLNQVVSEELEQNRQLQAQVKAQVQAIHANKVAQGQPVMEEVPAKETYKEKKRKRSLHTKIARSHLPEADYKTYDIVESLKMKQQIESNSIYGCEKRYKDKNKNLSGIIDLRLMRSMCEGYQQNKSGDPLNEEEAAKKQRDIQLIDDYASLDLERRRPHLQKFIDRVLSYKLSANMFSKAKLHKNATLYRIMSNDFTYGENCMKDPINKPFFEQGPPMGIGSDKLKLLNAKLDAGAGFNLMLRFKYLHMGVSSVHCNYCEDRAQMRSADDLRDFFESEFAKGLNTASQAEAVYQEKAAEIARRDAFANGKVTGADHVTYDLVEAIQRRNQEIKNSTSVFIASEKGKKLTKRLMPSGGLTIGRIMLTMGNGCMVDKNGNPINQEEQAKYDADQEILEDFASEDTTRRHRHLEKAMDFLLNMNLTPEMFTLDYVKEHRIELEIMINHLTTSENLMKDKDNADFYDDPKYAEKREFLNRKVEAAILCGQQLNLLLLSIGIRNDNFNETKDSIPMAKEIFEAMTPEFLEAFEKITEVQNEYARYLQGNNSEQ